MCVRMGRPWRGARGACSLPTHKRFNCVCLPPIPWTRPCFRSQDRPREDSHVATSVPRQECPWARCPCPRRRGGGGVGVPIVGAPDLISIIGQANARVRGHGMGRTSTAPKQDHAWRKREREGKTGAGALGFFFTSVHTCSSLPPPPPPRARPCSSTHRILAWVGQPLPAQRRHLFSAT